MRTPLLLCFLLAARAGCAQSDRLGSRFPVQTYPSQALKPGALQPTSWTTIAPTIPMNNTVADGLLPVEPDSARRRQYARARVRAVLKTRLNQRGEPQDTLEYQLLDPQGRFLQTGPAPAHPRSQSALANHHAGGV